MKTTRAAILAVILAGTALCPIVRADDSSDPVSYTHLTLPTN